MKTRLGMVIFVFFMGMILGATQPTLIYAGFETPEGFVWDQFIDPKPYPGVQLEGPISIYYDIITYQEHCGDPTNGPADYLATMYYTVRLNKVKAEHKKEHKKDIEFYTFEGKTVGVCFLTGTDTQGAAIKNFLGTVVTGIFPDFKSWKLKSVDNVGIGSQSFVADIEIAVKK